MNVRYLDHMAALRRGDMIMFKVFSFTVNKYLVARLGIIYLYMDSRGTSRSADSLIYSFAFHFI